MKAVTDLVEDPFGNESTRNHRPTDNQTIHQGLTIQKIKLPKGQGFGTEDKK